MCAFAWARSGCCFIEFRHYRASVMPANIYLTGPLTNGLIKSSQHCEWISVALPQYFMIRYRHLPPYYRLRELQSQTETFHQGNSLHLMRCFAEMQGYIFTCKIDNIWQILAMKKKKKTRRAKDYLHKEQCEKTILYENCKLFLFVPSACSGHITQKITLPKIISYWFIRLRECEGHSMFYFKYLCIGLILGKKRSGKLFYTVQHLHLMDVYNLIFQKRDQNYLVKWPTGSDGVCFHQETLLYRYLHEMFRIRVHKKKRNEHLHYSWHIQTGLEMYETKNVRDAHLKTNQCW